MRKRKIIISSVLGNALEFYDFTLYGAFAVIIGTTFFPSDDPHTLILKSLGTFAVGFFMRPFGATVFGYIGDRWGRKRALLSSILLMAVPTFTIGVLPSFQSIGWAAPIILIISRLIQGLCTGGEFNGAAIFALEHVGKSYPGMTGGLITASAGVGAMAAMGMGIFVTQPFMPEWGWRLAFIFGTLASFYGWYIRRTVAESPAFKEIKRKNKITKMPLRDALFNHKGAVATTVIYGAFDGVLSYIVFIFVDVYLSTKLGFSGTVSKAFGGMGIAVYSIASPIMGLCMDKFNRRSFLAICTIVVFCLSGPSLYLMHTGSYLFVSIAIVALGIMAASIAGTQHVFSLSLFPVKDRYSGIAFSYSVGISIGGLTPFLLTRMVEESPVYMLPTFYILGWSLLFAAAIYFSKKIRN